MANGGGAVSERPTGMWATEILTKAITLGEWHRLLQSQPEKDAAQAHAAERVQVFLDKADALTKSAPALISLRRVGEWWSGSRMEDAWAALHQAELLLASAAREDGGEYYEIMLENALAHASALDGANPVRQRLEHKAKSYDRRADG